LFDLGVQPDPTVKNTSDHLQLKGGVGCVRYRSAPRSKIYHHFAIFFRSRHGAAAQIADRRVGEAAADGAKLAKSV
jgi:hypothetical protein